MNFGQIYDRRLSNSSKWRNCAPDEIAMTTADMEFPTPQPIITALKDRLEHPFFGYEAVASKALPVVVDHYRRNFECEVDPEWLVYTPSVMPGCNLSCSIAGGTVMYCTPMYGHIRGVAANMDLDRIEVPLKLENDVYSFDFELMEKSITPNVKCFVLCNPHNPVGRMYTREELLQVVVFCRRHDLLLISDEIHCEFAYDRKHIPLFSLNDEAKIKTITLSSPGKICNIPKMQMAYAVIPDPEVRAEFIHRSKGLYTQGGIMEGIAFCKAYDGSCDDWKFGLRTYLRENRDYLAERMKSIPLIQCYHCEGTFLAWIDCTKLDVDDPTDFFLREAKVRLGKGSDFGDEFGKYVRMNFACSRYQLKAAIDSIEAAVNRLIADE